MAKGMEIFGSRELERTFKTLGERVQRKLLRQAVNAAATPVVKAAKSNAAKDSGLLKKAMGKKIVTNTKTQSATAVIGPRRDVSGMVNGKVRKPSRYAHLVEKGFIDEAGTFHPPHPFLVPALASTESTSIGILQTKLGSGIEKEALKSS